MSQPVDVIRMEWRNGLSPAVLAAGWAVVALCVVLQGMAEQAIVRGAIAGEFILRWRLFPIVLWGAAIPLVLGAARTWPVPGGGWRVSAAVHTVLFSMWMLASNLILRIPDALHGGLDPVLGGAVVAAVQHAPAGGLAWIALVALDRVRQGPSRAADPAGDPGEQPGPSPVSPPPSAATTQHGEAAVASGTPADGPVSLRVGYRTYLVAPGDIRWIEADGDYVRVHTDDRIHRVRATMKELQGRLGSSGFVRIHRSTLVNVAFIREVQPYFHGDYMVILRDGTELRVPRSRKGAIRRLTGSPAE